MQALTDEIGKNIHRTHSVRDHAESIIPTDGKEISRRKPISILSKPDQLAGHQPDQLAGHQPTVPLECSVSNVRRMVQQFEDHAIVDDLDLQKLTSLGDREVADIQDNKTDDDQPDLELDDSSGDKSKMKQDASMEGFTETTDITTPVEMAQESAPSKGVDFDTSYQISDLPEWSKQDLRMSTPETHHKLKSETLFDITDLDDLSDVEEDIKDNVFLSHSDQTLVPDRTQDEHSTPHIVETKIKIREDKIHEKFEKMSMSMSDPENTAEGEEFCQLSTSVLSKEDEEQAASNFDKILVDNFVEDKSEDWLTHESDPSPEKETGSGEIFGPPEKDKGKSIS